MTGQTPAEASRAVLAPGYAVSRVINGCWQLAQGHGGNSESEAELLSRFEEAVAAGFTTFDCADIYTGVESLLGRFLARPGMRERVQVHTKFVPDRSTLSTLRPSDVEAGIDRSLRRLGVERLDLVQFHWWDYGVRGCRRALGALDRLREKGKIRCIGLTNFDTVHVQQLLKTGVPITSLQLQYSLLDRRPERTMVDLCRRSGIALLAYGVLAGGMLGDRMHGKARPAPGNRSQVKYGLLVDEAGGWDAFQYLLRRLRNVAERHETSVAAIAAAWVLAQAGVAAVILGTGSRARYQENARMLELRLDDSDLDGISAALARLRVPEGDVFELERDPTGPHAAIMKTDLNAAAVT